MADASTKPPVDHRVKVVLVGASGSGKAAIVKAVAAAHARSAVRVGELGESRIFRTEFYWREPRDDGSRLLVRLFGGSGVQEYNAVAELLLAEADGVIFVANPSRADSAAVKDAFQALLFNAGHHGLDLARLPVAFQYHPSHPGPASDPDELDRLLGIPRGAVARFLTGPEDPRAMCGAVEWVVAQLLRGPNRGIGPARGERVTAGASRS